MVNIIGVKVKFSIFYRYENEYANLWENLVHFLLIQFGIDIFQFSNIDIELLSEILPGLKSWKADKMHEYEKLTLPLVKWFQTCFYGDENLLKFNCILVLNLCRLSKFDLKLFLCHLMFSRTFCYDISAGMKNFWRQNSNLMWNSDVTVRRK